MNERSALSGFSLLELMVVMVLVGIMASMLLPRMVRRSSDESLATIVEEINQLVLFARQEAIANHVVHRVAFVVNNDRTLVMRVEEEKPHPEKRDEKIYEPVQTYYMNFEYRAPTIFTVHKIYSGKDLVIDLDKGSAYCYVIPDGLVDEMNIQARYNNDGTEERVTLEMMPFIGLFDLKSGFVRPGQNA